jgi:hypothetical protein
LPNVDLNRSLHGWPPPLLYPPDIVGVASEDGLAARPPVHVPDLQQVIRAAGNIHPTQAGVPAHCPTHQLAIQTRGGSAMDLSFLTGSECWRIMQ